MNLATTLAIFLCFILALAIIWQLMKAAQSSSQAPSIVAGLIGIALGIVLCQAAWLLIPIQAPFPDSPDIPAKLIEAERQARAKDIATVTGRLDDLSKKQSVAPPEISQIRDDIGKLAATQKTIGDAVNRIDATLKPIPDTLTKLDTRVTAVEKLISPQPPPPPPPPRLTLTRLEVRPVQRNHPTPLGLYPRTTGGMIQFASIDFCPPPGGTGACTPASNTPPIAPNCTDSFICNGSRGTYVTIPPTVTAGTAPFCIRLTYILQDQTHAVAPGGPIELHAGAVWQSSSKVQNPCDQTPKQ